MEHVFGSVGHLGPMASQFLKSSPPLGPRSLQKHCCWILWLLVPVLDMWTDSVEIWVSSAHPWEEKVVEPRVRKQGVAFPESAADAGHRH